MGRAAFLTKVERGDEDTQRRRGRSSRFGLLLALLVACGGSGDEGPPEDALTPASMDRLAPGIDGTEEAERSFTRPSLPPEAPKVVVLGDSLSAGLHLPAAEAWPAVAADLMAAEGLPFELVNAGVSGDTTAGGLARLDWLLRQDPDLMVVELGGNDGLRGVELEAIEANLRAIVARLQDEDVAVLLLGMKMPPNYGAAYAGGFEALFAEIAEDTGVGYVPFFLDGVAADPELNLPDGLHPNTAGHRILAENMLPHLRPLVQELTPEPAE